MECANCGSPLASGARFCRRCGASQGHGTPATTDPLVIPRKVWIGAAAALALVVLLAGLAAAFRRFAPLLTGEPDRFSGPTSAELRQKLATELPAYLTVTSLEIKASENAGDHVQPVFRTRFQGVVQLTAPSFREVARENEVVIVAPAESAGTRRDIYGLAVSELRSGAWSTAFQMDNDPRAAFGLPRDTFSGGRVVVQGSPEEQEYRAEQRRRAEAADAAAREQQLLAEQAAREEAERSADIARRQREAEDEGRRQSLALLREPITRSIRDGRALLGEATQLLAGTSSFRMRFTTYDERAGTVGGLLDFGSCVTRFEGTVANDKLVFTETAFVRPSRGCTIGVTWRLNLDERPWTGEIESRRRGVAALALDRVSVTVHVE